MDVFGRLEDQDFGELHLVRDRESGLRAAIAIHDARLGPALGGCRLSSYADSDAAVVDALRLARGMTSKAALAGIPHGGGKAVLLRPEGDFDRAALFRAFGRFVERLGGRYITAEDSGSGLADMDVVREVTRYVVGTDPDRGGGGDPSPYTALGVRRGIQAAVRFVLDRDLEGVHVAVQGVGNVGFCLTRELTSLGAHVSVADVDPSKVQRAADELGAQPVQLSEIDRVPCDVFAPCALGSAIRDANLPTLACRIVAGAANNQLATPGLAEALHARGIAHVPDYAINAGGLICVAQEWAGYDAALVRQRTEAIYDTVLQLLERAQREGRPTQRVADAMVAERLAAATTAG